MGRAELYGYRQRKGSIMNDGDPDLYLAYRDALLYLRNQIRKTSLKELYPLFDSCFLRNMARKRKQALHRGMSDMAAELKQSYIQVYNETDTKCFPIKDKLNIWLARYCFGAYCLIHFGKNL